MKKIRNGAAMGVIFLLLFIFVLTKMTGAPSLTYVYSASMEPLIHVNDGFLVLPKFHSKVGEIIVYRPSVLEAELVTHRIIGRGQDGFITKGDNLPYTDQENGEPEVPQENVVGKVWEWKNRPVTFSKLGDKIDFFNGNHHFFRWAGILLVVAGFVTAGWDKRKGATPTLKSRRRWRVQKVGKRLVLVLSVLLFIQQVGAFKTETVSYLVSTSPSDPSQQFYPNQRGKMRYTIENHSILPVWYLPESEGTLQLKKVPHVIPPLGKEKMTLTTTAHSQTGWYKEYFHIYTYPAFLPYKMVKKLQQIHPLVSAIASAVICWGLLTALLAGTYRLFAVDPATPLKALHYKKNRQWERKMKLFFKLAERKK